MSTQNLLAAWLKPWPADILNVPKLSANPTHCSHRYPDSENDGSSNKKPRVTKKPKTPGAKPAGKKAPEGKKAAEQLYKKIIANVDKKVSSLDAQVKRMVPTAQKSHLIIELAQ
jgi:hypothetical protein